MKKTILRELIIKQQQTLVNDLEASINNLKEVSDLDEDALKDSEDFSHQNEAKEMERRINEQLNIAKVDLTFIEHLSDSPCDHVQVGALVKTDRSNFYICISTAHLDFDGQEVIGISEKAPIYQKMKHKKAGDSFEMANILYQIIEVS